MGQEKELHPLFPSQVETLNHQLIRQHKQETLCPYLVEAAGEGAPPPLPQPGRDSQSSADQTAQAGDPTVCPYLVEEAGEGASSPSPSPPLNYQLIRQHKQETLCPYLVEGAGEGAPSPSPSPPLLSITSTSKRPYVPTWWRRQEKELHPLLPSQVETLYHQLIGQSRY